ncbi:sigma-70 family RNA polymerase sigma factor [Halalkalibacter sp. APA_J-10(15)]|uniref:sigma-70 family RNA polymerase sigma factor n=1 Tax=Halalkalibacter sp. APA_J-10(15) TaxID=2933805 RepID=UPI001FF147D6|nr:sigma-70 family RNA polymerase sigma factor [Halalkalibacter sp. APA_J-10(15)]MCK0470070.1 sigma-70 family RNA polymerase sigma factor [Halalkalibacter sp. APA_J-10(15)]
MIENRTFAEVAKQYEPLIRGQIKKLNIYRNREEFYQVGLIGLWKAYEQFDQEKGSFSTIALFKVRGCLLDFLRKEGRYSDHHIYGMDIVFDYMEDEGCLIAEWLDHNLDDYRKFLTDREVQWLYDTVIHDKKPAQIAHEQKVSTNTVATWRKKAKAKLQEAMKKGELRGH